MDQPIAQGSSAVFAPLAGILIRGPSPCAAVFAPYLPRQRRSSAGMAKPRVLTVLLVIAGLAVGAHLKPLFVLQIAAPQAAAAAAAAPATPVLVASPSGAHHGCSCIDIACCTCICRSYFAQHGSNRFATAEMYIIYMYGILYVKSCTTTDILGAAQQYIPQLCQASRCSTVTQCQTGCFPHFSSTERLANELQWLPPPL